MSNPITLYIGDIVQIDPAKNKDFGGCLVIVTKVLDKEFEGYIPVPPVKEKAMWIAQNQMKKAKLQKYTGGFDDIAIVGKCDWIAKPQGLTPFDSMYGNPYQRNIANYDWEYTEGRQYIRFNRKQERAKRAKAAANLRKAATNIVNKHHNKEDFRNF